MTLCWDAVWGAARWLRPTRVSGAPSAGMFIVAASPTMGPMRDALDEPTGPEAPQGPVGPSTQSSTGLLERTEVEQEKSPGDGDRFAHFVRKDKADSSMITGQPVVALCGKVWIPSRDASKYPVCPTCKALRDSMGKNGRNWPFSGGSGGSDK